MRPSDGFTLIEVTITFILIAIMATYAVSKWPGLGINVQGQAQQLAQDFRFAQSLSMSKDDRYRLVITTGSSSYQILNSSGTAILLAKGSTTVTLTSGVSFGTLTGMPNNLIEYDGNGTPYTTVASTTAMSADATIPLTAGSTTKTITIAKYTGRVSIS